EGESARETGDEGIAFHKSGFGKKSERLTRAVVEDDCEDGDAFEVAGAGIAGRRFDHVRRRLDGEAGQLLDLAGLDLRLAAEAVARGHRAVRRPKEKVLPLDLADCFRQ